MIDQKNAALAAFALRLSLGIMYLAHGVILKYMTFTLAGTAQFFESLGLPAALWVAMVTLFPRLYFGYHYLTDLLAMRHGAVDDGVLHFSR